MSLLKAILNSEQWMDDANCKNMDTEIFFANNNMPYDPFVKEVCMSCRVIEDCAWYANETSAYDGVFGGMTPSERRTWRQKNKVMMGQTRAEWEAE